MLSESILDLFLFVRGIFVSLIVLGRINCIPMWYFEPEKDVVVLIILI